MTARRVLVFDSGVGGLSVAREIRIALPVAEIVYVADDAGFPYGDWDELALTEHVVRLIGELIDRFTPDAVVIACNTASTLVMARLRKRHAMPIVGTVPAIKPAAERTRSGLISVLATFGTIRRDYTRALIREFAGKCQVCLVGSASLAGLAEAHVRGEPIEDGAVQAEIVSAFVGLEDRLTDVVVLACTHYPFLMGHFERLAPWPVAWIDPAPAIARRVVAVLGAARGGSSRSQAYLTSGRSWPAALLPTLAAIGLEPAGANAD